MLFYTDCVNFKTAEILNNTMPGEGDYVYAAEDLETTNDQSIGSEVHKAGDLFCQVCLYVHGSTYYAPTIAEVLDHIANWFGVYVEFTPWHTYALKNHVAYTYKVFVRNDETAKMDLALESDEWLASLGLCIQEIVTKLYNGELGIDVNRE